ncbi:MAG: GGDEF domain-containing protein, partial [bacterium]
MYISNLPIQCNNCPSLIILERFITSIAYTDALTGLYNRRYLQEYDQKNLKELFSIMIVDADNFKYINDSYGHNAGDTALKKLGDVIKELHPQRGIRYGGDEFVVLLPNRNREYALQSGEQLLSRIRGLSFPWGFHVSVSIGIA